MCLTLSDVRHAGAGDARPASFGGANPLADPNYLPRGDRAMQALVMLFILAWCVLGLVAWLWR